MSQRDIHELARKIIHSVESVSEQDDKERHRLYLIGFLAGHLASILQADPILRREFFAKIERIKGKGPAAKG